MCKMDRRVPLVSVLFTAYQEPLGQFEDALASIRGQSYDALEILVVLDDPRRDDLRESAIATACMDERVSVIANERNLGLVASLNKAIACSHGDVLCRMDADDIALSHRIEAQVRSLVGNDLDLIGGYVQVIDEDGREMYTVDTIPTDPTKMRTCLLWNNCIPHSTWLGKRGVFEMGYRDIPFAEDYDLLLRAMRHGYRLGNVDDVVVRYRRSTQGLSQANLYEQFLVKRYLAVRCKEGRIADEAMLKAYLESNQNVKEARRFAQADLVLAESLQLIHEGNPVKGVVRALRIPFISHQYALKMLDMLKASIQGR